MAKYSKSVRVEPADAELKIPSFTFTAYDAWAVDAICDRIRDLRGTIEMLESQEKWTEAIEAELEAHTLHMRFLQMKEWRAKNPLTPES